MTATRFFFPSAANHRPGIDAETQLVRLAYTVDEVATLLGLSRAQVYVLIGAKELPARKIRASTRVLHSDLAEYLEGLPRSSDASMRGAGEPAIGERGRASSVKRRADTS